MISKTIGFRGLATIFRHTQMEKLVNPLMAKPSMSWYLTPLRRTESCRVATAEGRFFPRSSKTAPKHGQMDWFCWENLQETMVFTSKYRENLQETMVLAIKSVGLSGFNFPIIQFYDTEKCKCSRPYVHPKVTTQGFQHVEKLLNLP